MTSILDELNAETASLAEDVARALVQVLSGRRGGGAGTIWHPDGLIVTNSHVAHRDSLEVRLADGRTLPGRIVARDPARDLAALVVEASGLPTIALGDSRRLRPGEWVMALGHPWGVRGAATAGVVISLERDIRGSAAWGKEWVVVDLPLRPGTSGGPLVDARGRLVGISTMVAGPGVGIAVPVHVAKAFLREALASPQPAGEPTPPRN